MAVINDDYPIGIKREIVNALKPVFGATFPIPEYRNKVAVTLEYPLQPVQYPAVYITLTVDQLRNIGIGHVEQEYDTNNQPYEFERWWFEGTVHFNVVALNPLDRDKLASSIFNLLAFGNTVPEFKTFYDELHDSDYVDITLMTERILPGGEQVGAVPWQSEDELSFANTHSVRVVGELASNPSTGDLIEIGTIRVSGYTPDEPPPWT